MTESNSDRAPFVIRRLTDDELREFVMDFIGGLIFSLAHIPDSAERHIPFVFMPVAFGAFNDVPQEEIEQIGMLYEYLDQAGPRSINGMPMFMSVRIMHKDDWRRAAAAINRERQHQQRMEV